MTTNLIDEFCEFCPNYHETLDYIVDNDINIELDSIINENLSRSLITDKLVTYSIKYGILSILKFLYLKLNVQIDIFHHIGQYSLSIDSYQQSIYNKEFFVYNTC